MPENENTQQDKQITDGAPTDNAVADNSVVVDAATSEPAVEEEVAMPAVDTVSQTEAPIVDAAEMNKTQKIIEATDNKQAIEEIAAKINEAENILVALSNDPSVDEIAAAIGLTIALGKIDKHATAIYSGVTPNVLEFLEPEKTLEENADSLQDLIIALNKDKADHLRYKVDGEYVKIFVTPYKTKLTQDDFSYSYGDYNVDLVIALNVRSAISLDAVLREHGRIMHDASAVDITTDVPGRFGEIEWSNPGMSSVSEMVTDLLIGMKKPELDTEIATPLLAGIVAATERFKNDQTSPETMKVAGRLMEAGVDVQMVAENVTGETDEKDEPVDMSITVDHKEKPVIEPEPDFVPEPEPEPEPQPVGPVEAPILNDDLMEELKRQQEEANKPVEEAAPEEDVKDYGKMIDDALAELNAATPAEPVMETPTAAAGEAGAPEVVMPEAVVPEAEAPGAVTPEVVATPKPTIEPEPVAEPEPAPVVEAEPTQQQVAVEPELPMPSGEILPPPPAPEVNFDAVMPEMPAVEQPVPEQPATEQPAGVEPSAAQGRVSVMPETTDPSEFRIPGM